MADAHDEDFGLWAKVFYAVVLLVTLITAILAYENVIPNWISYASATVAGVIFLGWLALNAIDILIFLLGKYIHLKSSGDIVTQISPRTHGEWLLVVIGVGLVIWLIRIIF